MQKRGQITIFIIIAIVIVVAIVLVFVLRPFKSQETTDIEVAPIRDYVDNCVKSTLVDGIRLIGLQGGYFVPEDYLRTNVSLIAYGYDKENVLVSESEMARQIALYEETFLPLCFSPSEFSSFSISEGSVTASVKINDNSVSVSASYPLTVSKENANYRIAQSYESEVQVKLRDMRKVASNIIKNIAENPEEIELSYISSLSYDAAVLPVNDKETVYSITDKQGLENVDYSFRFAVRI